MRCGTAPDRSAAAIAVLLLVVALAGVASADGLSALQQLDRSGRSADALEAGRAALAAKSDDVRTARFVQDVLRRQGDMDAARAVASAMKKPTHRDQLVARLLPAEEALPRLRALKENVDAAASARLDLAWAYLEAQRARNAETEARAYAKAFPDDAEGHEVLGLSRLEGGSAKQAVPALEEALRLDAGRPSAAIALARAHRELDAPGPARTVLLQAVERYRENVELLLALAGDQVRTREMGAAETSLTTVLEKQPTNAQALYLLGRVKRSLRKLDEAEALARRLLALDEDSAEGHELLGFVFEQRKKWTDALTHYFHAARSRPDWVDPVAGAAFVQLQIGELDYAETMLETALELDEKHVPSNLYMGILHFLRRKNRLAKKAFEQVLRESPDDLRANRYMGFLLLDETKHKEAIACFEKVLKQAPDDAAATRMLGRAKVELGSKLDEAVELLERAVELDGKDPWNRFELGKAYEEQEEFDKAQEAYEAAIELDPEFAWPHLYLAELLDEVERRLKDALDHYQKFLELGGPDPDGEVAGRVKQLTGD